MKLTVIGCYGAYPEPGGATSGYLLEQQGTRLLLDCGSGVLSRLQAFLPLYALDGVALTHYHPDHDADLGCLHHAAMIDMQLGRRKAPLSVWGPGAEEKLSYCAFSRGNSYLPALRFQMGAFDVQASANVHEIPSYAFRVTAGGKTLVYSGDTGYYGGLIEFARGTDCFLCEASYYAGQQEHARGQHLTCTQAGGAAQNAGARRLILTHLPHFGELNQLYDQARERYTGELLLAKQGMQIEI